MRRNVEKLERLIMSKIKMIQKNQAWTIKQQT